jgi:hypothetical protein
VETGVIDQQKADPGCGVSGRSAKGAKCAFSAAGWAEFFNGVVCKRTAISLCPHVNLALNVFQGVWVQIRQSHGAFSLTLISAGFLLANFFRT